MDNQQLVVRYFRLFFTISGRMSRPRYWSISVPFWIVFWLVFNGTQGVFGPEATWVPTLVFLISAVCLSAKRLHDRDKSAWWLLLIAIPVVGPIWTFIELAFLKGTEEDNRFGENPLVDGYDYLTVK